MTCSAEWLATQPAEARARAIQSLSPDEATQLLYAWRFWARPKQLAPEGDWRFWLLLAGRGFGKTRTGAEWIRERVEQGSRRIILAGATARDVRNIMIEGESGILACSPPWNRPVYEPSKARLTWPKGARAELLSAEEPERFRGPQSDTIWCDELASWKYPDAFDQLQFGFRLGVGYGVVPRACISTTPKPIPLIAGDGKNGQPLGLIRDPGCRVTMGSTFENAANLPPSTLADLRARYEGTRLGRQELYAEILGDVEGALWSRAMLDKCRVRKGPEQFLRVVVAVDPAVSSKEASNETGIIVAGLGGDRKVYILADISDRLSPDRWARRVVGAFDGWRADRVVAETNQGGDLVEHNIRTVRTEIAYRGVHASVGKRTRAEPVAALYEQDKVRHVGFFPKLEEQLTSWAPLSGARSPDRLDALVWAVTDLALGPHTRRGLALLEDE